MMCGPESVELASTASVDSHLGGFDIASKDFNCRSLGTCKLNEAGYDLPPSSVTTSQADVSSATAILSPPVPWGRPLCITPLFSIVVRRRFGNRLEHCSKVQTGLRFQFCAHFVRLHNFFNYLYCCNDNGERTSVFGAPTLNVNGFADRLIVTHINTPISPPQYNQKNVVENERIPTHY